MSQFIKKTLSSIATLTTIVWSVGGGLVALPSVASAATISAGDLIKASGPAVYYYAGDSKRYVFPNETTYWSWYSDFSSVKTITDAELAAIQIGGNVTIRPGTKLVKITTDPKVYAVTAGGSLHWVESEAIATSLYGASWAQRVVDVPDAFFVNYTVGSSVSSPVHPDGTLVMMSGSTDKYVVVGGQKRMFASDAAFTANGYKMADVIQTTATYPDGQPVSGREAMLADTVYAMGGGTTPPPPSGSVSVSLASDTPAGMTLPLNSASVPLAKYNLVAGSAGATITSIKARRIGVGATTDFSNVYLYDGSGARLTTGRTINSTSNVVEFNSLNLVIPAGSTLPVLIYGDLSSPASTGGQHAFELTDAASVMVSGSGTVSGSFPVRGNVFTVGTASAGRLDVQKGTAPSNPYIGATEATISNFKLTANTNDIEVRRVTLFQGGSISNSDLSDLKLYQGNTLIASTPSLAGDKIVLNFTPPYVITNGQTKTFTLKARIAGRSSRTIQTYVEYSTDVYAVDRVYNSGAAVCIEATSTGCTTSSANFDGTAGSITVTTQGGQLTVNFNGPETRNIAKGTRDAEVFKFSLISPDNDLEIRNFQFTISGQSSNSVVARVKGASGTQYFTDIKVKNLDTGDTVMGPTTLGSGTTVSNGATTADQTISNSFILRAGQVLNLGITADISNTEDASEFFTNGTSTYKVLLGDSSGTGSIFGSSDVRIVSTGEFLATSSIAPNAAITGNSFTVKSSSLTVALASSPSSGTLVKKQEMVPSAAFVFAAGDQSDILITDVTLKGAASTTGSYNIANLDDVVTACGLYDAEGTLLGQMKNPDATLGTMDINNLSISIPRGTSKVLTAKCNLDSVVSVTYGPNNLYTVGVSSVTAEDSDSNSVTASIGTPVTNQTTGTSGTVVQTVLAGGTLSLATDSLPATTILVADGSTWHNFAQYRATAQYEDMRIERLTVTSTGQAANFTAVALAINGSAVKEDVLPSGAMRYTDLDLTQSPIIVPKDGSVTFQVWGKLRQVQASSTVSGATTNVARSGASVSLGIASGLTTGQWSSSYNDKLNVKAFGRASGDATFATSSVMLTALSGNSFVVRKSKPVVARQSLATTTLTPGTTDLYKFQVSADPAGSVALKKVVFTLTTATSSGSSLSLSNFRVRRSSTDMNTADYAVKDRHGNDIESGTWVNSANTSTGNVVSVVFDNGSGGEEVISGTGYVYTLYATVGGTVVSGDSITVSMKRTSDTNVNTGYLADVFYATGTTSAVPGPNISTTTTAGESGDALGTFVWSDLSEIPHYSNMDASNANRSKDWTDDLYVQNLTDSQVLSR